MFFVPGSYKFNLLADLFTAKFPEVVVVVVVVVGCNSGGQLIPALGYTENKISAISISADNF